MARCGTCWQPRGPRMVYGGNQPVIDRDGMLRLASYPDCADPYNELDHRAETLYVVGWDTPDEKVFPANLAKRALAYSQTFNPPYKPHPVLATQLCRQAVLDAYAME